MTYWQPTAVSIVGETSPVYAPLSFQYMFCAESLTFEPEIA